jgi:hypothetical protein
MRMQIIYILHRIQRETLISIYSAEKQLKVIKYNHIHRGNLQEYCSRQAKCFHANYMSGASKEELLYRYLAGEDILQICASVDFPTCMMMRRLLEHLFKVNKQVLINFTFHRPLIFEYSHKMLACRIYIFLYVIYLSLVSNDLFNQVIGDILRDPCLLEKATVFDSDALAVNIKERVRQDIFRCILSDPCYSPLSDVAKQAAGD